MVECKKLWEGKKKTKHGDYIRNTFRPKIMDHVAKYVKTTNKNGKYPSRQYPHTYLNNHAWDDELPESDNGEFKHPVFKYQCNKGCEGDYFSDTADWLKDCPKCKRGELQRVGAYNG